MFPLNLYARVHFLLCISHTRPRVQRAPGLPCALCIRGGSEVDTNLGRSAPRECGCMLGTVKPSLRAKRSNPYPPLRSIGGLLRFARNDVRKGGGASCAWVTLGAAVALAVQVRKQEHQRKRERPDEGGNPHPAFKASPATLGYSAGKIHRSNKSDGVHDAGSNAASSIHSTESATRFDGLSGRRSIRSEKRQLLRCRNDGIGQIQQ